MRCRHLAKHTRHLLLGFQPIVEIGGRKASEHQFLNVGLAAYVSEIIDLLNAAGNDFEPVILSARSYGMKHWDIVSLGTSDLRSDYSVSFSLPKRQNITLFPQARSGSSTPGLDC